MNFKKQEGKSRRIPWNKGLTIKDPRVKKYAENFSKTKKRLFSEEKLSAWCKGLTKENHPALKRLSERMKNNKFNLGNKHTKETILKMSKCKLGKLNPFYGKKHKEEMKLNKSKDYKRRYALGLLKAPTLFGKDNGMYDVHRFGEKNPRWLGGKSFEPYGPDFNKQFKNIIKERDACCLMCNIAINDLNLLKRRINVHHIDYIKQNNFKENCVCLCDSCHSKTNINREHWKLFFHSLLGERYGYKYTGEGQIIIKI